MTVAELIDRSTGKLAALGIESPRLQSELLLAHILNVPRLNLFLDPARSLTEDELETVFRLIDRRARHEPLQHIIGTACFCGSEIQVNSHVLIPRPETELLAEFAWQYLSDAQDRRASKLSVLDFGTGSGCLAVAIAAKLDRVSVWGVDISSEALTIADENSRRNCVSQRIRLVRSDGFSALARDVQFDLIVSNPPYIPSDEISDLAPEVRDHDPRQALDGGVDGLDFFRLLASEAFQFLKCDGRIMIEFGDGQEESIRRIFVTHGWKIDRVRKDLAGLSRFMIARPPESPEDME